MDIHMPEMDGPSATRAIRQWQSRHQVEATPILALTADTISHGRSEFLQAGCTDHLVKLISKSGLRSALSPYFSARESSA
ncbi:MAG TPA: response regulator [Gammaproteobacteria bacterium]